MRIIVIALLAMTALSGCFGLPEGSADFGDEVTIHYVALHADTGMPLVWSLDDVFTVDDANSTYYDGASLQAAVRSALDGVPASLTGFFVMGENGRLDTVEKSAFDAALVAGGHASAFSISKSFLMGSGQSGLGFDVERGILGMLPDETRTVVSRDDSTRGFSQEVERPRWLGETESLMETIDRSLFEQSLGEPTVGQTFQMTQSFQAEVIDFTADEVNVRLIIEDSYPADIVGGNVVPDVVGDTFRLELVLTPGAEFDIESTPFQAAPLELPDGAYKSIGTRGENVVWAFSASPAAIVGQSIEVIVTLESVTHGTILPEEGNYGARQSAVLPRTSGALMTDDDHAADGHADDGHTH